MALSVKNLVRRHGAGVAAVTAAAVAVALAVGELILAGIGLIDPSSAESFGWFAYEPAQDWYIGFADGAPPTLLYLHAQETVIGYSAFVVGMFLSLWIIAPIADELRVGHVIARSVLATGVGATLWFVALAVTGVALLMTPAVDIGGLGQSIPVQLGYALEQALSGFVSLLPLGVLAGVLLWLWRKDHAPMHPLSGLIDEV